MYKNKEIKIKTDYRRQLFILRVLSKGIKNALSAGLLLFFGYWLFFMSNMGPDYLPNIREGALDMGIRLTLLGFAVLIWLLTPIWFFWSSIHYGYREYQGFKGIN